MMITEILDLEPSDFSEISDIYIHSFPPNETRPIEETKSLLLYQKNYRVFVVKRKKIIGFAFVYVFDDFALLDYMAILPEFQGKSIGSKLFCHVVDSLKKEHVKSLLLEIQKEDDYKQDRTKRIIFYKRLGVKILIDNYYLPAYDGTLEEEMYLMMFQIAPALHISKDTLKKNILKIYRDVYNYKKTDLLERTLLSTTVKQIIPKEIMITNTNMLNNGRI